MRPADIPSTSGTYECACGAKWDYVLTDDVPIPVVSCSKCGLSVYLRADARLVVKA